MTMQCETTHIGNERFIFLSENLTENAIVILDPDGCILTLNTGATQIEGYSISEIIGKHFSLLYPEDSIKNNEPQKNIGHAKEFGRFETESWQKRKDGTVFLANIIFISLRDEKGNLIGFGQIARDLTKQKNIEEEINQLNRKLEKQLQKSQSQLVDYKHALDESSIVAITDQKGIIKHVNENFCKISKYSKEELLGQDHRIINSGIHSEEYISNLWKTIANGRIWRGELRNKAKDGTYYWVDTTIVPFLDEKNKPYQYLAIRSDITQRKLVEEQLYKSKEDLENKVRERTLELTYAIEREKELNEMKSRFVSMASHEFRTPLSTILSSTSLIEHYTSPEQSEKREKHIARIKSSVINLTNILDDFLSLEKIERGKVEIHDMSFDLKTFIDDVIDEMDGMLKRKEQKVNYVFYGNPQVNIDKRILRNIFLNLFSNAIKYSSENKEIHIRAEADENKIIFSIRDEGIGIPLDSQSHLFEKFYRADNAVNIQGTGLGLNIVKSYVDLLKGYIRFTSRENAGTEFTIELPNGKRDI